MHSYILNIERSKNAIPATLEDYFQDGLPEGADYTEELSDWSCNQAASRMEVDWFPFCRQGKDDPSAVDIDREAAKAELKERYAKASELFARMAKGESLPDHYTPYMAGILAAGDNYGLHFIGVNSSMNDLEFIRYCAEDENAPSRIFIRKVWDVHY